jgi:hypothetical protein
MKKQGQKELGLLLGADRGAVLDHEIDVRLSMRLPFVALWAVVLIGVGELASPQQSWTQESVAPAFAIAEDATPFAPDTSAPQSRVPASPPADAGNISGTVSDVYGDIVSGATALIEGPHAANRQSQTTDDKGFFEFRNLAPGLSYRVTVSGKGFDPWVSPPVVLTSGQYFEITGIKLKLQKEVSSVTVTATLEQIATEQVTIAEHQRILGFIPNFYVVYDSQNAVPLTTKLKFKMATRVAVDPVSFLGAAALSAMYQAGDIPDYPQGWKGYGQRFGAVYTDGVTDIMFGGAILPWLLHQDPRYFYMGKGPKKARMLHALSNPFVCKGDNGHKQANISSMGGDLISGAISNAYYPESNRGPSLVFTGFLISTGERLAVSLLQEFVIRRFTPSAKP